MELGQSIAKRVEDAISPLLSTDGFDVVLVEYVPRAKVLRLYIDREGGITLDDCARVSHRVGDLLDAEGLTEGAGGIDGQYNLEVSSPGLDRPLVRPAHFQRFVGETIQLVSREPLAMEAGRRKLTGKLVSADERSICVESEGQPYTLAYDAIERARLVPQL